MTRLALVGGGPVAEAYARSAHRVPEASIVAATDGAKLNGEADIAASYFSDLLYAHADEFDAVVVQTPTDQRGTDVKAAAAIGKHVLAEGPIALSAADARDAVDACAGAGVVLAIGQLERFRPDAQAIRASIAAGQIGAPGLVRSHRWQALPSGGPRSWELDPQRSGGLFIQEATRDIDVASWLFDQAPTEVFAVSRGLDPERPDWAVVHLGYPNGGMAVLDIAMSLPHGDSYQSLELIGADGAAYADDQHNVQLLYRGGSPTARLTDQGGAAAISQLQAFVSAVEIGSDPSSSAEAGVLALQVAEAARKSAATGQSAARTLDDYGLV